MRYFCWCCHKSVTSELPDDAVVRAISVCPECIQEKKILFPEDRCPNCGCSVENQIILRRQQERQL